MKNLPPKVRLIILFVALLGIIGLWYMAWHTASKDAIRTNNQEPISKNTNTTTTNINAPVDFIKIGTLTFNSPGLKENTPYFVFEEPGSPALSKEIVIDEKSICSSGAGTLPCLAMNMTLEAAYGGARVAVEGVSRADGSLLVRKINFAE